MEPLVTVDKFEAYLQRTLDPAQATLALAGASGMIRQFCRWCISAEATTFVVDGNRTPLVSLPTLRLTGVSAVRVGGDELDPDRYEWSANGQVRLDGVYPQRFRAIEVDCTHGYSPDDMPDEVVAVTFGLAARYYINPEGLRSKTVGSVSRTYVIESVRGDVTKLEASLLAGYQLP